LGAQSRAHVVRGSAKIYLAAQKAGIVFLDPPYDLADEYRNALQTLGQSETQLVIAQHERRQLLEACYGNLKRAREIRQGDNLLTFYRP